MGPTFHRLCPRYNGTINLIVPMAIRLWETLTFLPEMLSTSVMRGEI